MRTGAMSELQEAGGALLLASLERRPADNLTYLRHPRRRRRRRARVGRRSRRARRPALVAARRLCATPAPIRPRTDAGDVPAAELGRGIVRACGCPRSGCYYAPQMSRAMNSVFKRPSYRPHPGEISWGARYCWRASLREGEPTPRVKQPRRERGPTSTAKGAERKKAS